MASPHKSFTFSNQEVLPKVRTPVFIIHGTRDETCPYSMGESIFELAHEPKGFFSIPNGTHNDLSIIAGSDYWDKPVEFVEKYL